MHNLTDRQLALLCDLAALQGAGMLTSSCTVMVDSGYDAGSLEADVPGVVTWAGRKAVEGMQAKGTPSE